jgi:hypothetical protein
MPSLSHYSSQIGDNIMLNKCIDELSRHPEISECQEIILKLVKVS